jgi:hypothetical protein
MAEADKEYKNQDARVRLRHSKRTRASNIVDFVCEYISKKFADHPDIKPKFRNGSIRLVILGKYQLTFKKLTENLKPSYIPAFFPESQGGHQLDQNYNLPESLRNLVAGYVWQGADSSRFHLVCPAGDQAQWTFELKEPEAEKVEHGKQITQDNTQQPKNRVSPKSQTNRV